MINGWQCRLYSLFEVRMSLTRSESRRASLRSNGHPQDGNRQGRSEHRSWPSAAETEMTHLKSRVEELQAHVDCLEKEREQFASLVEAVPLGYLVMDENGVIKEANSQFQAMLGRRRVGLAPGPLAQLVVSADVPL